MRRPLAERSISPPVPAAKACCGSRAPTARRSAKSMAAVFFKIVFAFIDPFSCSSEGSGSPDPLASWDVYYSNITLYQKTARVPILSLHDPIGPAQAPRRSLHHTAGLPGGRPGLRKSFTKAKAETSPSRGDCDIITKILLIAERGRQVFRTVRLRRSQAGFEGTERKETRVCCRTIMDPRRARTSRVKII